MREKGKRTLTIKNEMFLLGFAFLIAVSLLFAGVFLRMMYNTNIADAKNSLRQCNSQVVTFVEGMFHENGAIVRILTMNDDVVHAGYGDPSSVIAVFNEVQSNNTNITYVYSGYADGSLLIDHYATPRDFNSTVRPWYQAASQSDGVASLVYSDAATGVWLFSQCMKLVDDEGNMVGAMCIDSSNDSIVQRLSMEYQYESQRSFILNSEGVVLIHPDKDNINVAIQEKISDSQWQAIARGDSNYAEYVKDGIQSMAYFERIPDTDFLVATAISSYEVTRPMIRSIAKLFALIVAISLVLGLILSRILIQRFALPFLELGNRIQNLAEGKADSTPSISSSNAQMLGIAESIEVIVTNIAKREEQREKAEYLSFHDSMTGLYNRRFFEEELRRLDVKRNYPLCLVCCDINGLKLTNDVFGHAVGDRLLMAVAEALGKACRGDDILARVGGDEFAIILPHTPMADAEQVLLRMKAWMPKESICGADVSASLGYALKTDPEQTLDDVMRAADEMMYDQKLMESAEMKRRTVNNIIAAAEAEGLIHPLTPEEMRLLDAFADVRCPDSHGLLRESYRLRRIGLCTLILSMGEHGELLRKRHTETSYRVLSSLDDYRNVAGCVLHYMEHWDGSGWPAGLSGRDIPLLSRIMAVVEGWFLDDPEISVFQRSGTWYDPELVELLKKLVFYSTV